MPRNFTGYAASLLAMLTLAAVLMPSLTFAQLQPNQVDLRFPYWGKDPALLPCVGAGVDAQGHPLPQCTNLCQLLTLFQRVAWFGITVVTLVLVPPFVAWGGLMIIFGGASESRVQKGRDILKAVAVGIMIALLAFIGVNTFFVIMGGSGSSWSRIQCQPVDVRP